MNVEIYHTLDINSVDTEVEFFCNYEIKNDGIGSYEFWGSREFDAGTNYVELQSVTWDKELYSSRENDIIEDWVANRWESIEKQIEEGNKEMRTPSDYDDI
jgi:hypothetical protein